MSSVGTGGERPLLAFIRANKQGVYLPDGTPVSEPSKNIIAGHRFTLVNKKRQVYGDWDWKRVQSSRLGNWPGMESTCGELLNISDEQKSIINDKIADEFISVRVKFVDLLLSVDNSLYNTVLGKLDNFQQHISETVFDNGVKLSHAPKFDELILVFHTNLKTEIISTLFKYKG